MGKMKRRAKKSRASTLLRKQKRAAQLLKLNINKRMKKKLSRGFSSKMKNVGKSRKSSKKRTKKVNQARASSAKRMYGDSSQRTMYMSAYKNLKKNSLYQDSFSPRKSTQSKSRKTHNGVPSSKKVGGFVTPTKSKTFYE